MNRSIFVIFFILFVLCLISSQGQSASMYSHFTNNKLSNIQIRSEPFDAKELHINESRFVESSAAGKKENDIILMLPGQPIVNFKQYGGYVTVDKKNGKALYYYFVEARDSPDKSPLLLWLNGGPGCSSLGYGAMQELGPFRVESDGKTLCLKNYAWNQVSNVLFLESPAGVGFSYSNTTTDYVYGGDNPTATDNYVFLINWLERFSEYKTRDVYIAGESYAGHYVPQLAQTILYQNDKAKTTINLKGIMIGNAAINKETDNEGIYRYWGSHALISDDLTAQILRLCGFSPKGRQQKLCNNVTHEAWEIFGQIDVYNIYGPLCHNSNLTDKPKKSSIFKFDPCTDYYVEAYLNSPDVQMALHANITNLPYNWQLCSQVFSTWTEMETVLPILKDLMNSGLRVWLYSGDTDGRQPVTSTQLAIKEMKLHIKDSWRPWYIQGEVGGYTEVYEDNLTFATIRGAGHAVPSFNPESALSLITHFLEGNPLPKVFCISTLSF